MTDSHPDDITDVPSKRSASLDDASEVAAVPPSPAPLDLLLDLVVDDRYRIKHRLAQGGMASVYVAQDTRLDRPVAIKIMHQHLAEDPHFLQRFNREARSAARILHPGVVSVSDQGSIYGRPYLVMDLVDGPNLRDLLRRQGAFTLSQSLKYCADILQALRAAHRIGVIHRDIKPENVLVPSEGPARVTDFGLARALSEASTSVTTNMLGTVTYMAPEVATHGEIDARTDLYSVGIMLYEMLTGEVPWHGENAMHIAYSHVHDDVPAPSDEQPWIPREVDDFVAALCARQPQERLSSADEAISMLERLLSSIPTELYHHRSIVSSPHADTDHTAILSLPTQTAILPAVISSSLSSIPTKSDAKNPHTQTPSGTTATSTKTTDQEGASTSSDPTSRSTYALAPTTKTIAPTRSKRLAAIIATLLVFLSIAGAGTWWWWNEYGPGAYIPLPITDGRAATDVRADIEALGLSVEEEESFSDDVLPGVVISSRPASETSAHKSSTITLIVSRGPDLRTVPELVNTPVEEARKALEEVGLTLGEQTEDWSEDIPAQSVISQSEPANTQLKVGSSVNLVISKGRQPRSVPDLKNMTSEEAKAALEELELVADVREAYSDTVEKGRILSQDPAPQTSLYRGDTVVLTISLGPEMVEVPQVFGKGEAEAIKILQDAGFVVDVKYQLGGFFRTAHSTEPTSGTSLPKGSTIVLNIV